MRTTFQTTVLLLTLASGCVSRGSYDDLKQKYDTATGRIAQHSTTIADLQESLRLGQQASEALSAQLVRAQAALRTMQSEHDATQARAAALMQELEQQRTELAVLLKDK